MTADPLIFIEAGFTIEGTPGHGTVDFLAYFPSRRHMLVADFKYGAGHEVSAEQNEQLLYYGAAAMVEKKWLIDTVELLIIQPRAPSGNFVKSWETTGRVLWAEYLRIVREIEACYRPDAPLVSGEWCRWCPAAAMCPERRSEAYALAVNDFLPEVVKEQGYSPELLATCYEALPRIEAWCKSVSSFAHARAAEGHPPPGFKLVAKNLGPRKWAPGAYVAPVLEAHGIHPDAAFEDPKLKSPTQVEKLVPKDARWMFNLPEDEDDKRPRLVVRESTGTTLVPESDKRQAVNPLDTTGDFAALSEGDKE